MEPETPKKNMPTPSCVWQPVGIMCAVWESEEERGSMNIPKMYYAEKGEEGELEGGGGGKRPPLPSSFPFLPYSRGRRISSDTNGGTLSSSSSSLFGRLAFMEKNIPRK